MIDTHDRYYYDEKDDMWRANVLSVLGSPLVTVGILGVVVLAMFLVAVDQVKEFFSGRFGPPTTPPPEFPLPDIPLPSLPKTPKEARVMFRSLLLVFISCVILSIIATRIEANRVHNMAGQVYNMAGDAAGGAVGFVMSTNETLMFFLGILLGGIAILVQYLFPIWYAENLSPYIPCKDTKDCSKVCKNGGNDCKDSETVNLGKCKNGMCEYPVLVDEKEEERKSFINRVYPAAIFTTLIAVGLWPGYRRTKLSLCITLSMMLVVLWVSDLKKYTFGAQTIPPYLAGLILLIGGYLGIVLSGLNAFVKASYLLGFSFSLYFSGYILGVLSTKTKK